MIRATLYGPLFFACAWLLAISFLTANPLQAQENCSNGIDDDGDQLIDCFDPDCCDQCLDHYFYDCDTLCNAFELKDSIVLQRKWRYTADWDRRSTPLVGQLEAGQTAVIGPRITSGNSTSNRDILVINGQDGMLTRTINTDWLSNYGQSIGMADLNNDGRGEIIVGTSESANDVRRLNCYSSDGSLLWQSSSQYGYNDSHVTMSPQFTDFNQDGSPEVYVGNQIFDGMTGALICEGGSSNNYGQQASKNTLYRFFASTAADILPSTFCADCDGLELIAGNQVYAVDIASGQMSVVSEQVNLSFGDGLTAIADMNNDGDLDIVVAQRINHFVNIWVWDPRSGDLLHHYTYVYANPDNFSGASSVPLLTDIDFDGDVDVVFSTTLRLVALENDGMGNLQEAWTHFTSDNSGRSGPVAFDFDGNGFAEIVHRGSNYLRVLNAPDGKVLDSLECYSPTYFDKAIVADVDDRAGAEIVCGCGNELWAISSGFSQWSNTRPVWNQMNYFNIHINNDLTVPAQMQAPQIPNIDGRAPLNRYLEQYSQPEKPTSDLYIEDLKIICSNGIMSLSATLCNQGDIAAPPNVFFNIYTEQPLANTISPVWTTQILGAIEKDQCRTFQYNYPISNAFDTIYASINVIPENIRVDTTNDEHFVVLECSYENNFEILDVSEYLATSVDLSEDSVLCPGEPLTLDPGGNFFRYLWSDSSTDETLVIDEEGLYSLTITDDCGNRASDSVQVSIQPLPNPFLPNDTSICMGDTIELAVNGFDSVSWFKDGALVCAGCAQLELQALSNGTLIAESWMNACSRKDSVVLDILETPSSMDTIEICPGDSVLVDNEWVGAGSYTNTYSGQGSCDSIAIIEVVERSPIEYSYSIDTLCQDEINGMVNFSNLSPGLNILWEDGSTEFDRNDLSAGNYAFTITGNEGCELEDSFNIIRHPYPVQSLIIQATGCEGDSLGSIQLELINSDYEILLNGMEVARGEVDLNNLSAGMYSIQIQYEGCSLDTNIVFEEYEMNPLFEDVTINAGLGDTVLLGDEVQNLLAKPAWEPSVSLSCDDCLPALAFPDQSRNYILTAMDSLGCRVQKAFYVKIDERTNFYIPNIFTPNGDGVNDEFVFHSSVPIRSIENFRLYDRWGALIIEKYGLTGNEIILWDGIHDGIIAHPGVYVYYIKLITADGRVYQLGGDITLMR